jgi:phosphate starvation-inducible PhoH-like protein
MSVVFGPAGSGKTYIPAAFAAAYLNSNKVKKIILTRPNIPAGKSIGFLPGTMQEKIEPWVAPILSVIKDYLDDDLELCLKKGKIEIIPFETIRGHTFKDAFVILDEAQNTTVEEMKAFTTRIGENAKVIVNGDISQSDLRYNDDNGLSALIHILDNAENSIIYDTVNIIEFSYDDIVRSALCREFVKGFDKYMI